MGNLSERSVSDKTWVPLGFYQVSLAVVKDRQLSLWRDDRDYSDGVIQLF
jgi:hypothetical protein